MRSGLFQSSHVQVRYEVPSKRHSITGWLKSSFCPFFNNSVWPLVHKTKKDFYKPLQIQKDILPRTALSPTQCVVLGQRWVPLSVLSLDSAESNSVLSLDSAESNSVLSLDSSESNSVLSLDSAESNLVLFLDSTESSSVRPQMALSPT